MKYITQVAQRDDIKHIIEVDGKNVEVVAIHAPESYGDKKGEQYYLANGVKVATDYTFLPQTSYDYTHLAQVVFAIELVRFTVNHISEEK